jgi:hypothetical protein
MEHALPRRTAGIPRTWSLCMTSENHGTVGPAGCTFSHAPDKHERVLVVEVPAAAGAPVDQVDLRLLTGTGTARPPVGELVFRDSKQDATADRAFLQWVHDRMRFVHGENENVDYMHKLRAIIASVPPGRDTPNVASVAPPPTTREVAAQAGQVAVPSKEQIEWSHDLQERLIANCQDITEDEAARQVMAEAACFLAELTGRPSPAKESK